MSIAQKKEFLITARRWMALKQAAEHGQLEALIFMMDELKKASADIFQTQSKLDSAKQSILSWCSTSHKLSKEKLAEFSDVISKFKASDETPKTESHRFTKFNKFKY